MTKESPMTNGETSRQAAVSNWLLVPRHSSPKAFGVSASSLVIHGLLLAIRVYRWTISPAQTFLFGPTGGCRFTPTCSQYAMDAIREHGALAGGWLAVKRICRCHPWGDGGHDPVPKAEVRGEKAEGGIILEHTH
jgi:putative membrane protein insertion efficiency factor